MAAAGSRSWRRLLLVLSGIGAAILVGFWADSMVAPEPRAVATEPGALPSGLTLTCTNRYQYLTSMGPTENGKYVHFVCQDGKVTSWWEDDNSRGETAQP